MAEGAKETGWHCTAPHCDLNESGFISKRIVVISRFDKGRRRFRADEGIGKNSSSESTYRIRIGLLGEITFLITPALFVDICNLQITRRCVVLNYS